MCAGLQISVGVGGNPCINVVAYVYVYIVCEYKYKVHKN